jgi:hypothetical protein
MMAKKIEENVTFFFSWDSIIDATLTFDLQPRQGRAKA